MKVHPQSEVALAGRAFRRLVVVLVLIWLLIVGVLAVSVRAQASAPQPLTISCGDFRQAANEGGASA